MDGTEVLSTKAGVDFCMLEWEVIVVQEPELVNHKSKPPEEVCWLKILGWGVRRRDERHVCSELMWWMVLYLVSSCLAC